VFESRRKIYQKRFENKGREERREGREGGKEGGREGKVRTSSCRRFSNVGPEGLVAHPVLGHRHPGLQLTAAGGEGWRGGRREGGREERREGGSEDE